ncbi:MAG TPA: hypothetical protein VF463_05975 [Sphingobium sp.]
MDAPIYPPATRFVQPEIQAEYLSTAKTPIARLKANPAAWAIILKQFPNLAAQLGSDMLKPHLGNFSLRSLTTFGIVNTEGLDAADIQLRTLGEVK